MVDMASKKILQAVLCPTQLFQWKLICTFNQHCLATKFPTDFNSTLFCFFSEIASKLCCIDITFLKMCRTESRNFDCQWTLVSFLVKHNQFYREARLTCPLYRSTEEICIGICVFKRVFNVWHILKKKCVNVTTFCGEVKKSWIEVCWEFCS